MSKQWFCGYCEQDMDPKTDGCGSPDKGYACPLWWQPVTWFEKLRCKYFRCSSPYKGCCKECDRQNV